ncbi:MAG: RdgB/HAM1 family non-canonical purine NTP pyrophosphatase [Pseudomonadota bacterium]
MTKPQRAVLASGNAGKLRELRALLASYAFDLIAQNDLGISAAEEPFNTFVENALAKARHASTAAGLPALADDSGLAVRALGGAPGVRSARYAGPNASDRDNIAKLLDALGDSSERDACFFCTLVFVDHPEDPTPLIASGRWDGTILLQPTGDGGFGYDPVFYDASLGRSAAQLTTEEKAAVSHRGRAMQALATSLRHRTLGNR